VPLKSGGPVENENLRGRSNLGLTSSGKVSVCPSGEQITNGGLETGDMTGYTYFPNLNFATTQYAHTGVYSCFLYENWVQQDFSKPIPKKCIKSFGFWGRGQVSNNECILHFSDDTEVIAYIPQGDWQYVDLLAIFPDEKELSYIKFIGGSGGPSWIDDVSLIC